MNESVTLVAAKNITEDKISSITRVVELTNLLDEVKRTCDTNEKRYETEDSWRTSIAAQHTLMQQKKGDTLPYSSGAVASLVAFLKKVQMFSTHVR